MTIQEAIKKLDENIPEPNNKMVDLEHLPIAIAWKKVKEELEQALKETAREIIKDLIGHRFAYYIKDETNGTVTCCADYVVDKDDVKFLEEKYGIEVEE